MATHTNDLREQPRYSRWLLPPPIWPAGMVVRLGLGPGLGPGAGEGAGAGAQERLMMVRPPLRADALLILASPIFHDSYLGG